MIVQQKPAAYWIEKYQLSPHPEGGFYAETYRSDGNIAKSALPEHFGGDRSFATGIYFLLESHHFSAFHRIQSDEMWHFYAGGALEIFVIHDKSRTLEVIRLGNDPEKEETFQAVVSAGSCFASRLAKGTGYALVGCTVAPGFDFQDFEMADRHALQHDYPEFEQLIGELTRL